MRKWKWGKTSHYEYCYWTEWITEYSLARLYRHLSTSLRKANKTNKWKLTPTNLCWAGRKTKQRKNRKTKNKISNRKEKVMTRLRNYQGPRCKFSQPKAIVRSQCRQLGPTLLLLYKSYVILILDCHNQVNSKSLAYFYKN